MLLIILLYALLAATFPIGKILLIHIAPLTLVGVRMCLGGSILLGIQYLRAPASIMIKRRDWAKIIQTSLFLIYLSYALEFWAMARMPSFKTCTFFAFGPFITYAIACTFFKETLKVKKIIGLGIGFCGIIPLLAKTINFNTISETIVVFSWPELAMLGSVAAYCYGWFTVRTLTRDGGYAPFTITGISMLIGGILALISTLLAGNSLQLNQPLSFWLLLLLLIGIGNIAAYNLYAWLLKRYSTTFLSMASVLEQLWGAFFGWLVLGEYISWEFFLAMGLVTTGLYVFYSSEIRE